MKTFLYDLCGRKYQLQEFPENFLGKFGDIRAKIFRTPKHFPALTPMSQTHTHTHTHHNLFENQTVKLARWNQVDLWVGKTEIASNGSGYLALEGG